MDGQSFNAWLQGCDVSTEGGVNLGTLEDLDCLDALDVLETNSR